MKYLLLFVLGWMSVGHLHADATTKKVGIMWVGKASMQDRVAMGFMKRSKVIAPSLNIELRGALLSFDEAKEVYMHFQKTKDAVVFLRSSGARFLLENPSTIPAFFGGCSNPVELGCTTSLEKPDKGLTGVSYFQPYSLHFAHIMNVFPNAKKVCLLVEAGHPSAVIDESGTVEECEKRNIELNVVYAKNLHELLRAAIINRSKCDLFILGSQALVFDNTARIIESVGRIPVIAYTSVPVKKGALFSLSANDLSLGEMLADSVYEMLYLGKSAAEIPIKLDPNPELHINKDMELILGVKVPVK